MAALFAVVCVRCSGLVLWAMAKILAGGPQCLCCCALQVRCDFAAVAWVTAGTRQWQLTSAWGRSRDGAAKATNGGGEARMGCAACRLATARMFQGSSPLTAVYILKLGGEGHKRVWGGEARLKTGLTGCVLQRLLTMQQVPLAQPPHLQSSCACCLPTCSSSSTVDWARRNETWAQNVLLADCAACLRATGWRLCSAGQSRARVAAPKPCQRRLQPSWRPDPCCTLRASECWPLLSLATCTHTLQRAALQDSWICCIRPCQGITAVHACSGSRCYTQTHLTASCAWQPMTLQPVQAWQAAVQMMACQYQYPNPQVRL